MGQQQLLLIVLGVIIVGIAVVVGINLFNANSEESAKDTIVSEATNLGAMAQQYYKKPTSMGGGGNKFDGFVIPSKLATDSSAGVAFTPVSGFTGQSITLTGTPFSTLNYSWTVTTTVTDSSIKSTVQ
jgi:type II secretory pathway pseudopilin PulG